MKKIIAFAILLVITINSFCQKLTSDDYLLKSKNQRKTGWILLIGGTTILITSFVIPRGDLVHDGICVGPYCSDKYKNDNLKTALFISGVALDLASIPFFIASKKNKKRAMNVSTSFKMEKVQVIQASSVVSRSYPALWVKVGL